MSFTAKDVAALRASTGVGMMDCKRALEVNEGDVDKAIQYLREKGLTKAAERADRENNQGCVSLVVDGNVGTIVQLKCETDFVASSDQFKAFGAELAKLVAATSVDAVQAKMSILDDMKITLKENIELGRVIRIEAAPDNVIDFYLHTQGGRGVNAVLVEIADGSQDMAHEVALHAGFAKPKYVRRDDVTAETIASERVTLENITRNEGKPEQAIAKIVEGRINGFFKENCLLEQPYIKDEKLSVQQMLGSASLVNFAQVIVG